MTTAFTFFLTLAATSVELYVAYSPYWQQARDLRVVLASGPLQEGIGANLNYVGHWANLALLDSDRWRYWTPFLDPAPFAWY